ncbi:MAG TPA: MFS transporter [Candidatus Binatia bacterium]|jgi:EmrB/QacA subfamily drug resistance transporter|nr:MFS transporter [Candidatus Binatia bacterium]
MIGEERPSCDVAVVRTAPETPGCASYARKWVLAATILGSSLVFMVASVINVALPAIQASLGATVAQMQWVASAYTILLAALTLAGGAAGDRFGRRRMFLVGTAGLALASVAASMAPDVNTLVAARAAQGLAAALLSPNSLALLSAAFPRAERGKAIGTWSAATSITGALSPMLGGWFVDAGSWRVAFAATIPPALLAFVLTWWRVPDPPVMRRASDVDWVGAALATLGLFGIVSGIIGVGVAALVGLGVGIASLIGFVVHERRTPHPMLPPALFASGAFRGVNLVTVLVYAGITGAFFVLPFNLVQVQGYSAIATGAAFLPFALIIGLLSSRTGALADRIGTKSMLVAGPVLAAFGLAAMALPGIGGSYWTTFFGPMALAGLGMAFTVAPLTTSVLAAVSPSSAGVASGVNSTAARVGTLLAVAVTGVVTLALYSAALEHRLVEADVPADVARTLVAERRNLADTSIPDWVAPTERPALSTLLHDAFLDGFRGAVLLCAALVLAGAAVAAVTLDAAGTQPLDDTDATPTCDHLDTITDAPPRTDGCEECLRLGETWIHLRACLACGHVGCCDSSKHRHASRHFWASQHPIVRSAEPGETWRWCYVDEIAV